MNIYINEKWPDILTNNILVLISVFIGAFVALQFTKELNQKDEKKNYLSMLNSCKNMNERYLKKFKIISDSLNSQFANYAELNRSIENIKQPYLLEEVIINSDLYKCSSIDFRNWLPDIIAFFKETNWTISKENIGSFNYNKHFLFFLKEILNNEENFINQNLCDEQLAFLNNASRMKYHISTKDIPISDIIIQLQKKDFEDSTKINKKR